jgi:hypothetical protein
MPKALGYAKVGWRELIDMKNALRVDFGVEVDLVQSFDTGSFLAVAVVRALPSYRGRLDDLPRARYTRPLVGAESCYYPHWYLMWEIWGQLERRRIDERGERMAWYSEPLP